MELTVTAVPGGGRSVFTGFVRDMTDRKLVEKTLRESREQQQLLAEAIPQQVWTAQPDGTLDFVNERVIEYFGRSREEIIGAGWLEVLHPDDVAVTAERWSAALTTGKPYEVEFRLARADGSLSLAPRPRLAALRCAGRDHEVVRDEYGHYRAQTRRGRTRSRRAALSSSLDYETTLKNVVDLVVPEIADWCIVDLLHAAGEIRGVACAHNDQSKVELVQQMNRDYPPQREDPVGVASVLRTGQPEIYPAINDELLRAAAKDEAHFDLLKSLRLRSAIVVPMRAGTEPIGALTLVRETENIFTEADLPFAQDLATRAALSVENSRLYSAARRANAAKDHFFAVLSHDHDRQRDGDRSEPPRNRARGYHDDPAERRARGSAD